MNIVHVDFARDRGIPVRDPKNTHVFIVDNFAPSPSTIRNQALSSDFAYVRTPVGYSYNIAEPESGQVRRAADLMYRLLGPQEIRFLTTSKFVYETEEDEILTRSCVWVHFDAWRWVGIHYLNPPHQCQGGTAFYQHRETGQINGTSQQAPAQIQINAESTRMDHWKAHYTVDLVWNRLLLFNPQFFHAPIKYFGSSKSDARLYQLFVFE